MIFYITFCIFYKMQVLGNGSYANIYKLDDKTAVKIYKNELHEGIAPDMLTEISILKSVTSPYIIRIEEIYVDRFVMPLYEYNLNQYLSKNSVNVKNFFHSICFGIYILHAQGIAHRDLKPSNIMVKDKNTGVLIDFGFAKRLEYDRRFNKNTPKIITSWYRPPEVFDEQEYHLEVDIWSAGCILARLCINDHLFDYNRDFDIVNAQCFLMGTPKNYFKNIKVKEYEGNFDWKFAKYECRNLLKNMLCIDHTQRYTITKCLNSNYFQNSKLLSHENLYNHYLEDYVLDLNLSHEILPLRQILVLWMLEVCGKRNIPFFRSVVFLDKFIYLNKKIKIKRINFQLIGMACIWIACKLDNSHFISANKLLFMCDNAFIREELIKMEEIVLSVLDYELNTPVLYNYIGLYAKRLKLNEKQCELMNKYLHMCVLFPDYYQYNFSDIAYICGNLTLEEDFELSEDLEICKGDILKWIKGDFEMIHNKFRQFK